LTIGTSASVEFSVRRSRSIKIESTVGGSRKRADHLGAPASLGEIILQNGGEKMTGWARYVVALCCLLVASAAGAGSTSARTPAADHVHQHLRRRALPCRHTGYRATRSHQRSATRRAPNSATESRPQLGTSNVRPVLARFRPIAFVNAILSERSLQRARTAHTPRQQRARIR
jgi:hypothetical protein